MIESKLYEHMRRYASRSPLRLHTPGHKGRLCEHDLTELTDGSFPNAVLDEVCADIARIYGAKHARLLSGGSSQGVKAAIYHAAADGIADVNSHRSVFDGFRLAGKSVTAVGVKGGVRPITVADIDGALTKNTGVVVVTSPTYFGYCADIDGIADYCKRKGLLFVVDGAHGAHFGFAPELPPAFAGKCDICNVSTHKTLDALTQSALLLDNLEDNSAILRAADIMGTTSPSYLLYASAEHAVRRAAKSREAYAELYGAVCELRSKYKALDNDDFTRVVLDCAALGTDAAALNAALTGADVYPELVTDKYIVFILTAADGADSVARLSAALAECLKKLS